MVSKITTAILSLSVVTSVWAGANKKDAETCYDPSADVYTVLGETGVVGLMGRGIAGDLGLRRDIEKVKSGPKSIQKLHNELALTNDEMQMALKQAKELEEDLKKSYNHDTKTLLRDAEADINSIGKKIRRLNIGLMEEANSLNAAKTRLLSPRLSWLGVAGIGLVLWDACGRIYRWGLEDNEPKPISEAGAAALASVLDKTMKESAKLGDVAAKKKLELRDHLRKQRAERLRTEEKRSQSAESNESIEDSFLHN